MYKSVTLIKVLMGSYILHNLTQVASVLGITFRDVVIPSTNKHYYIIFLLSIMQFILG